MTAKPTHFVLPAELRRGELKSLRMLLLELIGHRESLRLDGSCVLAVDGPGVQLLLAAGKSAQAAAVPFELVNPSQVLSDAISAHRAGGLGGQS